MGFYKTHHDDLLRRAYDQKKNNYQVSVKFLKGGLSKFRSLEIMDRLNDHHKTCDRIIS
jgi:hypothetical protein